MKKWISVILAVVTLCTLCTVLPAGAAAPYDGYAYVCETFEDGQTPSGAENKLVQPGVGNSAYAVRRTITATSNPLMFPLNLSAVAVGDNLKLSAWVRPKTATAFSTVNFTLVGYDTDVNAATRTISAPVTSFTQNEWTYVETLIPWDCKTGDGLDWADSAQDLILLVDVAIPDGATTLTYDIDDIIVEPTQATVEKVYPNLAKDDLINGDFESFNDNANIITRTSAGWQLNSYNYAAKAKKYSDSDPRPAGMATTSNTYMHLPLTIEDGRNNTSTAVGYGYSSIAIDEYGATTSHMLELKPGHTYKVDYWVRANGDNTCTVAKYNPVFVQKVKASGTHVVPVDENGFRASDAAAAQYLYVTDGIEISNNGGWQHVEYYLQFDHKSAIASKPMPIAIALRPVGSTDTNYETFGKVLGASFDYDEIQILDMGPIANGDFEIGTTANVHYSWAGYKNKPTTTQSVLGWTPSQTTITALNTPKVTLSQSDVVRPGQTGHSMKVTVTAAGGTPYQAVGMEAGEKYKISFWAKGNNMPTNIYMMILMNRSGNAATNDSYTTTSSEYIWGPDASQRGTSQPPAAQRWLLTNNWQYYEFVYDNTFPLKSGLTQPNANTFPKIPWLQFSMLNTSYANIPAGYEYYLDDFTIEPYDPLAPPVDTRKKEPFCSAITFSGAATVGQPVGVESYTYMSEREIPQATSILRVMKDVDGEWAQVAVKTGTTPAQLQYTIPADLAGEDIRLELIPMDTSGHFGVISAQEYTVTPEVDATATFSGDGTTTPVSVSVDVANSTAASKNITVILALYDENNTMLDIKYTSVVAATGLTTVPADPTSTVLTAALKPTATSARVFVLDGTSVANAGSVVWKQADTVVPIVPAP